MTEKELKEKIDAVYKDKKLFDSLIGFEGKLSERNRGFLREIFDLFRSISWQVSFNNYKELKYANDDIIDKRGCGTFVKVRPCGDEYGNKTYFGILLGDIALSISHVEKGGVVTASHSMYNPAIYIPDLRDIVYGCGCWWSRIETKEDAEKFITDDSINSTWYVKILKEFFDKDGV
jgi:hypothetical protein